MRARGAVPKRQIAERVAIDNYPAHRSHFRGCRQRIPPGHRPPPFGARGGRFRAAHSQPVRCPEIRLRIQFNRRSGELRGAFSFSIGQAF